MLNKFAYQLGAKAALSKIGAMVEPIKYKARDSISSESSVRSQDEMDELWRTFDRENQLSETSKIGAAASTFGIGQALKIPGGGAKPGSNMAALPKIPNTPKPQTMPGMNMGMGMGPAQQSITDLSNNLSAATSMQSVQKRLLGNVI